MSTLFVNNLNTASGSTIQVASGKTIHQPGAILQTVTTELSQDDGALGTITSASFTELTALRCTITPKLTGSKIYYRSSIHCGNNHTGGSWYSTRLQVAGSVISENSFYANEQYDMIMNHTFHEGIDPTSTTAGSARRYDSFFRGGTAVPFKFNWPAGNSLKSKCVITLMEIAQ